MSVVMKLKHGNLCEMCDNPATGTRMVSGKLLVLCTFHANGHDAQVRKNAKNA